MLDKEIVKRIEEFVSRKPRSINEVAEFLGKNWRTADRYIEQIKEDYGSLNVRVFRKGTRGALKVVYYSGLEGKKSNVFQKELEEDIFNGKTKEDFHGFDIYQFVEDGDVWVKKGKDEIDAGRLGDFISLLRKAKKQVMFFSGNLSFINFKNKKVRVFSVLDDLVKRGVKIKIVCRVDVVGKKNVEKILSLNKKYGNELVEVRHREQPLRVTVVDGKFFNIKEERVPTGRKNELDKKIFIFYNVYEKKWVEWITNVFWKMFNSSISAEKRLEKMRKILF